MTADELVAAFVDRFGSRDARGREELGLVVVDVATRVWGDALRYARDHCGFAWFDWLTGVATPDGGVSVSVHLWRRDAGLHLLLRVLVAAGRPLPSATAVYPGAAWHERETAEMFGVDFSGFRDAQGDVIRPLLLPALADVRLADEVPPDPQLAPRTPLRKEVVVAARAARPWPGRREAGESGDVPTARRRGAVAPGVPDVSWGPRESLAPVPAGGPAAAGPDAGASGAPPERATRPRRTKRQSEGTPSLRTSAASDNSGVHDGRGEGTT